MVSLVLLLLLTLLSKSSMYELMSKRVFILLFWRYIFHFYFNFQCPPHSWFTIQYKHTLLPNTFVLPLASEFVIVVPNQDFVIIFPFYN